MNKQIAINSEATGVGVLATIHDAYKHRELFLFLVWRDIKVLYAQSVLGISWAIVRPLFAMIIFTVIFGRLASVPSDGLPYSLFAYSALVPWFFFASTLTKSTESMVSNSKIWSKVYFPRVLIPLSPVIAGLVDLVIASLFLGLLMVYHGYFPSANLIYMPVIILLLILTASGAGLWLSALAVQYRDVKHATQFLTQLMMYAAPVVWPVSLLTEKFPDQSEWVRIVFGLYPMAGAVEGFRSAALGQHVMPWDLILPGYITAVLLFWSGCRYFAKRERFFADVI